MGNSSINYQAHFEGAISRLRAESRYRVFANLERDAARFPTALWRPNDAPDQPREVTIWCSNDYLGMGGHGVVRDAAKEANERHGVGAGGTRALGQALFGIAATEFTAEHLCVTARGALGMHQP